MGGINRADNLMKMFTESRKNKSIQCVFLSHQKKDSELCRKIADYLMAADIDVYFDEYDNDLKIHNQTNNPKGVVESIRKGIDSSSHMLVIVSPNTMNSNWVPWEIGYGYDKTELKVLCLKGIPKGRLPEYIRTIDFIRDIWDLNLFIALMDNTPKRMLFESNSPINPKSINHPLLNVMDKIITDK